MNLYNKTCLNCTTFFTSQRPEAKYCSTKCSTIAFLSRRKEKLTQQRNKICPVCQMNFLAKRKDSIYCSAACKQKKYRCQ